MSSDTFSLLFGSVLLLIVIIGFVRISIRVRKHGGSLTTMHATTYEFLSKDNRAAIEQVVEVKANKKMEEHESGKIN